MKKIVKEAVNNVLEYLDNAEMGYSDTTARVLIKLGYDALSFDDMFDVDMAIHEKVEKSRGYVLDRSEYDGMCVGLPFNLEFIKSVK